MFLNTVQPQDFIILLLAITQLSYVTLGSDEWDVLDFFAGRGRISTLGSALGYRCAAYDIERAPVKKRKSIWRPGQSVMDMNSDAGFVCPARVELPAQFLFALNPNTSLT